jgi:hypothetical protein
VPTVQWQVSTDGGATFTDIGGATSTTLAFTAAGSMSGYKYRAVFTSPAGCASPATTTAATLGVNKLNPVITWSNPANTTFGGALSNVQLNATASVPGTFVYTPPVGTVLPAGNAQTLSVLFTPTDTVTYNTATATVLINVLPAAGPATLVITRTLSRDGNNDVLMTLTIANTGGSPATAVQWTTVKIGTVDTVTPLPAAVPNVPAGGSQVATFRFAAASVGASGSAGVASYNGVYTGGTFGGSSRITLP